MDKTDIIELKAGKIQGYKEDGLEIFKNIPFAEPPIGNLRFHPSVSKKPWDGVLETTEYGNVAWQGYTQLEEFLGKDGPEDEDCLNLNIWTPSTSDDAKRPVMVWINMEFRAVLTIEWQAISPGAEAACRYSSSGYEGDYR